MTKLFGAQQAPPGQGTRFAQSASSAALGSQGNYNGNDGARAYTSVLGGLANLARP